MRAGRQGAIFAINPEKIIAACEDPKLLHAINESALLIPDGVGAVLAARLSGARSRRRVPGADLMPELCALAARQGAASDSPFSEAGNLSPVDPMPRCWRDPSRC